MNTLSREHTTDPMTANVQNLLVMSASGAFRQEVIRTAIIQTLEKNERVLFVTPQSAIQNVFRQYRGDLPPNTARYLDTLGSEHAPLNRPFAAFAQQQVLFTIPAYLHRQLVIPTRLISESVAHEIGLVVIDSLDGHDPQIQAMIELFLLRFCLHPVDGILRRAVVTVQPIVEPSLLADWLRADLITDPLPAVEARPFVSAWTGTQQREIVLTLAAGDGLLTPQTLDTLAQHSLAPGAASLAALLPALREDGVITDADTRLHPAAYRLTRIGEIMTRQRLSFADVRHLQRGLRLDHLAWLDLLLVAATSPDFPSMPTLTEDARGRIAQTLTTLHSALITTTPLPDLFENLRTTPEQLIGALAAAVLGYYVTRGWTPQQIAAHLDMEVSHVEAVTTALRCRVAALRTLTTTLPSPMTLRYQRIQTLWHMLTGISPTALGLASLPHIAPWVIERLRDAGILSLTHLIDMAVPLGTVDLDRNLLRVLQQQARTLLRIYPDESAYLATFTNFSLIGDVTALLYTPVA